MVSASARIAAVVTVKLSDQNRERSLSISVFWCAVKTAVAEGSRHLASANEHAEAPTPWNA
jgi:hypothetical protein